MELLAVVEGLEILGDGIARVGVVLDAPLTACPNQASITSVGLCGGLVGQPTTRREYKSSTTGT